MKKLVCFIRGLVRSQHFFVAVGFLSCMTLWMLLFAVQEMGRGRTISESKAAGLASVSGEQVGWDPISLWRQPRYFPAQYLYKAASYQEYPLVRDDNANTRKVARKGSLQLFVKDPVLVNDEVQRLTRSLGGFVASASRTDERSRDESAELEIRIPAERFEVARAAISRLAIKVESEQVEAADVTKQYVDLEGSLRNYAAQEERYREVLKQAKSVKDILLVTAPLEDVRSKIDKTQGELQFLKHQVEMSSLQIGLHAEAESKVLGVSWRPLSVARRAFHESIQALVTYADLVIAFLIKLPVMLIWLISIGGVVWAGYRAFRLILRKLFAETPNPEAVKA